MWSPVIYQSSHRKIWRVSHLYSRLLKVHILKEESAHSFWTQSGPLHVYMAHFKFPHVWALFGCVFGKSTDNGSRHMKKNGGMDEKDRNCERDLITFWNAQKRKGFQSFDQSEWHLSNTPPAQCPANEERSSSSGVILSPGFPSNYPNSQTCSWLLHMIPGKVCVSTGCNQYV